MFIEYKSPKESQIPKNNFLETSNGNFENYDEEQLKRRSFGLIDSILGTKNYLYSEEYLQNVQNLVELVYKVDFRDVDQDDLSKLFNYLLSFGGEQNYDNIAKNERLFLPFVDLILAFMYQEDEKLIFHFIECGLMKYVKSLLFSEKTNFFCAPALIQLKVYGALGKIVEKSDRIQKEILKNLEFKQIDNQVKSCIYFKTNEYNETIYSFDEERLIIIYKFFASFIGNNMINDEIIQVIKLYISGLKMNFVKIYPAISIGLYKKIQNFVNFKIYKNLEAQLNRIFPLLYERMEQNEILCEYTFFISHKLIYGGLKIDIDYAYFQSFLSNDSRKVQIACVCFFINLSENKEILRRQKLDVIQFLWELHLVYQNSSYNIKEYLDKAIYLYLKLVDNDNRNRILSILEDGFTETLVQMIQTIKANKVKNFHNDEQENYLSGILYFLYDIFDLAVKRRCEKQFSVQFMKFGGFDVLHEFFDDYEFDSFENNNEILALLQQIIQRFEPSNSP